MTKADSREQSLALLRQHFWPHDPESAQERIEKLALFIANHLASSKASATSDGRREFSLSTSRRDFWPDDKNLGLWAIRRMVEAGLVTIEIGKPIQSVSLERLQQRKFRNMPVRDTEGRYVPDVVTSERINIVVRSHEELWVRWREHCILPTSRSKTTPKSKAGKRGRKRTNPKQDQRISDAWATGPYHVYDDLARELGIDAAEVEKALDRQRKRRKALPE